MQTIRSAIRHQVHRLVGHGSGEAPAPGPRTDQGLFGPDSVTWRVHRDFTSMMIGGVSSLLLQMLHPGALGGVWDHSNFRRDMSGRLRRTAQFISGTTYGSTDQALRLIERVRHVHERVHGELPDGTPYRASDPALLTWVHVAEVRSFLSSYLRYRNPALSAAEQDRYFAETAIIARHLGATSVPTTRLEVEAYLEEIRPDLRWDRRTRQMARALLSQPSENPALAPFSSLMLGAGVDLLPGWASEMHGFRVPARRKRAIRAGALGTAAIVRWALREEGAAAASA